MFAWSARDMSVAAVCFQRAFEGHSGLYGKPTTPYAPNQLQQIVIPQQDGNAIPMFTMSSEVHAEETSVLWPTDIQYHSMV